MMQVQSKLNKYSIAKYARQLFGKQVDEIATKPDQGNCRNQSQKLLQCH